MREGIQFLSQREGLFGPDRLSEALRGKVREMILTLVEAELGGVLAALPYQRNSDRRGYRNGKRSRSIRKRCQKVEKVSSLLLAF
jgi:transposase-like protein